MSVFICAIACVNVRHLKVNAQRIKYLRTYNPDLALRVIRYSYQPKVKQEIESNWRISA